MKVDLRIEPWPKHAWHNYESGPRPSPVKRALPFVSSSARIGSYVHRVRSATVHWHFGSRGWRSDAHIAFRTWCGMDFTRWAELHDDLPTTARPVCATCEGRAVGAGEPGAAVIVRHPILFSPREVAS